MTSEKFSHNGKEYEIDIVEKYDGDGVQDGKIARIYLIGTNGSSREQLDVDFEYSQDAGSDFHTTHGENLDRHIIEIIKDRIVMGVIN
ncbi:hypothetical protein GCM10009007_08930 [Formosimonas limnophila]|uniref:Uncharacterized protein n=1 Tax=Formosimonas limnophila TaxID=1384487 RepID=A0A8J3CMF6_9BURK|nr:hypothetical protein [Formosimonas limnophila]GHA70404.1 hypothetical protein GCM10009007_08930 [Formosimonas limnophila]